MTSAPARARLALLVLAGWLALPGADAALAQSGEGARRHSVLLRDGTVRQGIVFERVPGEYLHLWLPEGRPLRLEWGQVASAQWARFAARPRRSRLARVRFEAPSDPRADVMVQVAQASAYARHEERHTVRGVSRNTPGARWVAGRYEVTHTNQASLWVRSQGFRPLCTAPCTFVLPPGSYRFGLVPEGDFTPVSGGEPVLVDGPGTVELEYHSNLGLRLGLAIGGSVAALLGSIAMGVGLSEDLTGLTIGGILGMAGGMVAGVYGALWVEPYVEARFRPSAR